MAEKRHVTQLADLAKDFSRKLIAMNQTKSLQEVSDAEREAITTMRAVQVESNLLGYDLQDAVRIARARLRKEQNQYSKERKEAHKVEQPQTATSKAPAIAVKRDYMENGDNVYVMTYSRDDMEKIPDVHSEPPKPKAPKPEAPKPKAPKAEKTKTTPKKAKPAPKKAKPALRKTAKKEVDPELEKLASMQILDAEPKGPKGKAE